MNESRQSKIEEIRKKSLETLRDARLAEQEKRRLDARFKLNEAAPGGAAGGAAGGAGGGGGGIGGSVLGQPLKGITSSKSFWGSLPIGDGLLNRDFIGGTITRVMEWMPTTRLGENTSELNRSVVEEGSAGSISPAFNEEAAATFGRQIRDLYLKTANETRLGEQDGTLPLNRNLTYQFQTPQGSLVGPIYDKLNKREQLELLPLYGASMIHKNPGTEIVIPNSKDPDNPLKAPQGNIINPCGVDVAYVYSGNDLGLYESTGFGGAWKFNETPVVVIEAAMLSQKDELIGAAKDAGENAELITNADTAAYKNAAWPDLQNSLLEYGDTCTIFDGPFPGPGEVWEGAEPKQYTWQPAYTKTNEEFGKFTVAGHWQAMDEIEKKSRVIDWAGSPTTVEFDLATLYDAYKNTRDSANKATNETYLAAGPQLLSAGLLIANWASNYNGRGFYTLPAKGGKK